MPKYRENSIVRLRRFVDEFGKQIFKTDGKTLLCILCEKGISCERKSQITQHIQSQQHKQKFKFSKSGCPSQPFFEESVRNSTIKNEFVDDLCCAFVGSNIPIYKVNSLPLRQFLEKYTNKPVPSDTTLRKCLHNLYDSKMLKIKQSLAGKKIWISIDETCDIMGRKVANVIVGVLEPEESKDDQQVFLLDCVELSAANQHTIAKLFDESINMLCPDYILKDDVLIFVSDAAPYMVAAARGIKVLYPNLIHVTCLAHALHRIAEEIRFQYPDVDKFVSNCKKIFSKAPSRIQIFQNHADGIPLPPKPVITRWGTWLKAVVYYNNHKNVICKVLNLLDENDAASISVCKQLTVSPKLFNEICHIACSYGFLSESITKLEKRGLALVDGITIIDTVVGKIDAVCSNVSQQIKSKIKNTLAKNSGLQELKNIVEILKGNCEVETETDTSKIKFFKYAPLVSVDTERSFSMYNNVLTDNRTNFSFENLKKHVIVYCNAHFG